MPCQPYPAYYTDLAPFQDLFQQGLPVLTYHKLGRSPGGVRLKGLYVQPALFGKQLAGLRQAGFTTAPLEVIHETARAGTSRVVVTFDDGFHSVLEHGLGPLAENRFTAIEFLVADRLGQTNDWEQAEGERAEPLMGQGEVREWLAAGHAIGSHTLDHPHLTRISRGAAREQIMASRKKLEDVFGVPVRHFCYPYGDWNEAVRDLVAEAGYSTACTVEWGVNPPGAQPWALKRITARYRSRNWKNFKLWVNGLLTIKRKRNENEP